jgi:hypothetical protein
MKKSPSEYQVFNCIFELYEASYPGSNDPYISIDINKVANKLKCKKELLFGYLYYYLDEKYRYKQDGGIEVPLFLVSFRDQGHSVNFPFLAAILGGARQEYWKQFWSITFPLFALVMSVLSLAFNMFTKTSHQEVARYCDVLSWFLIPLASK